MRRLLAAFGAAFVLALFAAPAAAQVGERIVSYDVLIRIEPSGDLHITETIDYDFGSSYKHGILRNIPTRFEYDAEHDRVYPLTVESVTGSPGTPTNYVLEDSGEGETVIRVGDADTTITGRHTYVLDYRIQGAMNGFRDHQELYWNAIGDEWPVSIESATVRVETPADITEVACFTGPQGSTLACDRAKAKGTAATFSQDAMYAYEAVTVVIALPPGTVTSTKPILEERWTLKRALGLDSSPAIAVAAGLLALIVGGFGGLVWLNGRDRRYRGSIADMTHGPGSAGAPAEEETVPLLEHLPVVVEFAPPEDLRPGQIGTLIDEAANPLDVTATIVDLAVRGFLQIEEIEKKGLFGKPDWKLTRLRDDDTGLLTYEELLLHGIFRDGPEVKLSELKTEFVDRLHEVQEELYKDAVQRGWFVGRPDKVRERWGMWGTGVLVLGGALTWFAAKGPGYAIVPATVAAGGLLLLVGARWMPRRAPKGSGMLRRVQGFREVIRTAETHMARWMEQENIFSKFLPYAIVFGYTDKWAKAFAGLAQDPTRIDTTYWYLASRPFIWNEFSEAMDGFAVTASGTIASTPSSSGSSGFGGGGFSGGGGGGGGGGSW